MKIPLALESAVELAAAAVSTRRPERHYFRTYRLSPRGAEPEAAEIPGRGSARRVGHVVERVARVMPTRSVCLQQALATHRMLRRRGHSPTVIFGVAPDTPDELNAAAKPEMIAHAWVEVDGVIANGARADLDRFAIVGRYG